MRYTREELYNLPVGKLVDIILDYQKTDAGKIFITPEQFDAFFKIRGLATSMKEILGLEDIKRERRGKKKNEQDRGEQEIQREA